MDVANKSVPSKNWEILLESLRDVLKTKEINKAEVTKLLSEYESVEDDWMQYVFFDDTSYTRNLVDTGNGIYNLMLLAWNPSQGTCIHNHANSSCFVKMLAGAMREIRYETPQKGKEFAVIEDSLCERDQVLYIEDSLGVHEMRNESPDQAISLHLYIPPFDICNKYNRKTAVITPCAMTFTSIYGEKFDGATKSTDVMPCC